jgi:hypothetical protein
MTTAQKLGLAGALVVIIALGSHVTRWSGFEGLMTPAIVLGAAALLVLVGVRRIGGGAYRTVHGHSANWKAAAAHEAAHAGVARYVGSRAIRVSIKANGAGWTSYCPPEHMPPVEDIAIALAGGMGEGVSFDSPPCRGDKASVNRALRRVSWGQRASTVRRAERLASVALRQQRAYVASTEKKLLRSGKASSW